MFTYKTIFDFHPKPYNRDNFFFFFFRDNFFLFTNVKTGFTEAKRLAYSYITSKAKI